MAHVKRGVTTHARHKKVLKAAKGYRGRRKSTIRVAMQAVEKQASMLTVTARYVSVSFALCGFSVLTQRPV